MKTYPSKIDAWLVCVLGSAVLLPIVAGLLIARVSWSGALFSFLIAAFDVALLRGLVFPCRYTFFDDELRIDAGFLTWRIPYRDIRSVEPSGSPLSSPALSLKRVKIVYGRSSILVSPEPREEFIAELRSRIPRE